MAPGFTRPEAPGAGAERLHALAAVQPGEGLRHLAPAGVLDADEEDAQTPQDHPPPNDKDFHPVLVFGIRTRLPGSPRGTASVSR